MAALVIALVVRGLLPFALEAAVEHFGSASTGVPVLLDDVDLELLRGGLRLEGLTVAAAGTPLDATPEDAAKDALLRLTRLEANLQWTALLAGRIHFADFAFVAPEIAVSLDEYGSPILPEPAPERDATEGEPASEEPEAEAEDAEATDAEARPAEAEPDDEEAPERPEMEPNGEETAETPDGESGWPIVFDRFAITGADVRVLDPALEGPKPAVEFGFGSFELGDLQLADGQVSLGGVGLTEPMLEVRRDYVLATRPTPPPAGPDVPDEAEPQTHRVDRIAIERAEFTLHTDGGAMDVAVALEASNVTTARGERFPFQIDMEIGEGRLSIGGEAGLEPAAFTGHLAWQELPVEQLALAADPSLAGWLRTARAAGKIDVTFDPTVENALVLEGNARIDDFDFAQPDGDEVSLRWKSLEVDLARTVFPLASSAAPQVEVAAVKWAEPKARYTIPTPSLDALLGPDDAEPAESLAEPASGEDDGAQEASAPPPASGAAPRIRVRSLDVTGGDIRFVDRTVQPVFDGRLTNLRISASGLRLPENRASKLDVSGQAPGGSAFSLSGAPEEGGRLLFELDRLGLDQFESYTASAVGYRARGAASLETEIELEAERIDASNQLVLHGIGLESNGEATLDRMIGMPVDLALALLRDLGGDIRLGIPVAVERGGVSVSVGAVIRDAVRAAIAGAVMTPLKLASTATSPLKALGGALSKGRNDRLSIPALSAVPGQPALAVGETERIEALVGFLVARPRLLLVLHGRSDEADRDGLARRMLVETVQADEDLPELEDVGFFEKRGLRGKLEALGRGEAPELDEEEQALLARYEEATFVPPERYDALAIERAESLKNELVQVHGVDAARLRVAPEAERGDPGVRAALGVVSEG